MRSKKCIHCKKRFFDLDFPSTFDRQLTCGSVECAGERRRELWRKRHDSQLSSAVYA